ncbi:MAG: hypothetical protein UC708_03905 [Anaerovoracaceae bacterium]|nr:hypothetical protein [Anaerovoracaceae bacterium]
MQSNIFAAILRKGVRLMIQLDNVKASLPEMKATLKEVGDSL